MARDMQYLLLKHKQNQVVKKMASNRITVTIDKEIDDIPQSTTRGEMFYVVSAEGRTMRYLAEQWKLELAVYDFIVHVVPW